MKLENCPVCGEPPELNRISGKEGLMFYGGCDFAGAPSDSGIQAARNWNRLANLVRKGRMFEWLEKHGHGDYGKTTQVYRVVCSARDWWRKRRAK